MQKTDGSKFDYGKTMWNLLDYVAIEDVAKVLTFGANKYSADNWKKVPDAQERYFAAAMRHLTQWRNGEAVDSETNISHLAHAMCNLMFLHNFDRVKVEINYEGFKND